MPSSSSRLRSNYVTRDTRYAARERAMNGCHSERGESAVVWAGTGLPNVCYKPLGLLAAVLISLGWCKYTGKVELIATLDLRTQREVHES